MKQVIGPKKLKGIIQIPSSKSDGQRALLAAALANGKSELRNVGTSDDELAMKKAIQLLGAKVLENDNVTIIEGGIRPTEPLTVSAGESGLGIRLLSAVCASFDQEITINGTGSLLTRPMNFFEEVLPQLGVSVQTNGGKVPVRVKGPIKGGKVTVDGSLSSQFISGCLMALPFAKEDSVLFAENLTSLPYVQMTLSTLKAFGIEVERLPQNTFKIACNQKYLPSKYIVEADWSSASYFLVASAIGHDVQLKGLNMASLQADKMLLDALLAAGCKIQHFDGTLKIDGFDRKPFEFDAAQCPDLFPALVTLAASINGETRIFGANRLTHKESNRALTLQEEFGKLGVKIDLEDDLMIIYGTGKIKGGSVKSHHDHRIAMCLAIAGTIAESDVEIDKSEAVSKSFPSFWDEIVKLS
jgi:3-phosphoshikimate 1-carboxyvinyltransferase